MKRLEILINHLNFGFFFPLWYWGEKLEKKNQKITFAILRRIKTKQQIAEFAKRRKRDHHFVHDLQLFYLYNFIDLIVSTSIAIMLLVITVENIINRELDDLLISLNIHKPAFLFLLITSWIISCGSVYYFFHLHDKREKYFEEFDKEPIKKKWKWTRISLAVYIFAWIVTFAIRHILTT